MLDKFRIAKSGEIAALRRLLENGNLAPPEPPGHPDFFQALKKKANPALPAILAEYKRASPSRGPICESLSVEDAARQYAGAGASALSILTEEKWFGGSFGFLDRGALGVGNAIPVLRKDFIFDPVQILATASTRAAAILLIVRIMPNAKDLREARELAESLGMEAVVEIFDEADLALARDSGARIIQANARDLERLLVDRRACLALAEKFRACGDELWIQASGIGLQQHLREAAEAGFDAALVGTELMRGGRPGEKLRKLLNGENENAAAN